MLKRLTNRWQNRQPFFGPNAWPLVVQLAIAVPLIFFLDWAFGELLFDTYYRLLSFIGVPD
jgi:hypothetical protein